MIRSILFAKFCLSHFEEFYASEGNFLTSYLPCKSLDAIDSTATSFDQKVILLNKDEAQYENARWQLVCEEDPEYEREAKDIELIYVRHWLQRKCQDPKIRNCIIYGMGNNGMSIFEAINADLAWYNNVNLMWYDDHVNRDIHGKTSSLICDESTVCIVTPYECQAMVDKLRNMGFSHGKHFLSFPFWDCEMSECMGGGVFATPWIGNWMRDTSFSGKTLSYGESKRDLSGIVPIAAGSVRFSDDVIPCLRTGRSLSTSHCGGSSTFEWFRSIADNAHLDSCFLSDDGTSVFGACMQCLSKSPQLPADEMKEEIERLWKEYLASGTIISATSPVVTLLTEPEKLILYCLAQHAAKRNEHIIEIGRFGGGSTQTLAKAISCAEANEGIRIWSIDPWAAGTMVADAGFQLSGYRQRIVTIVGGSERMLEQLSFVRAGLVFIDGAHTYAGVNKDAWNSLEVVSPGGYICFHDYLAQYPGICRAVNEFYDANRTELDPVIHADSLIVFRKRC